MRERMATVETAFADVKWNKGFRRFKLKGLEGARVEWTLIHIERNLARLGKALWKSLLIFFKPSSNPPAQRDLAAEKAMTFQELQTQTTTPTA